MLTMIGIHPRFAALSEPVRTEGGLLSGIPGLDPAITAFKGVPFAAPPVGELRWQTPRPPLPWKGARSADRFGKISVQTQHGAAVPMGEDCLLLNLYSAGERRPVFMWIYGGRFIGGAGSEPHYDGEGLAREGLVVVMRNGGSRI